MENEIMGKYIIEVDDKYVSPDNELIVSHKNLFDGCSYYIQIAKLTPYAELDTNEAYQRGVEDGAKSVENWNEQEKKLRMDEAYQRGMEDTWECMKKIIHIVTDQGTMIDMFGCRTFGALLEQYTPVECIEKIRQYEQEKEIHVGDEVLYEDEKGVVIVPEENGHYAAAFTAGGMRICEPDYKLRKTGKHYPEIVKILQEMRKK